MGSVVFDAHPVWMMTQTTHVPGYWGANFPRTSSGAMVRKYSSLVAWLDLDREGFRIGDRDPLEERDRLRELARQWPGILRECQLVHPDRIRRRQQMAARMDADVLRTRAAWRHEGAQTIVLWADLHLLLQDQLCFRRIERKPTASDFLAWLEEQGPADARGRWPLRATDLIALGGDMVRPRQAYAWLAIQSGITRPELHEVLFECPDAGSRSG